MAAGDTKTRAGGWPNQATAPAFAAPSSTPVVAVAVVEDHELVAEALGDWVNRQPGLRLAGCAGDEETGLQLCLKTLPGLVLLDIGLPGSDGLELAFKLRALLPSARLLVMSGKRDPYTIWRVAQSRVHGFIDKSQSLKELDTAVHTVLSGGRYYSPACLKIQADWLSRPEAFHKILSTRERAILARAVAGQSDNAIAAVLKITEATVKTHRRNIRRKLGLHSDRELGGYARRWGLDTFKPED